MNPIHITHLYPTKMCIYGDLGNVRTLVYRLEKLGFTSVVSNVNLGENLPNYTDIYFIGGGQDNDQFEVFQDLLTKKNQLEKDVEDGVAMLAICGGYQLLGKTFLDAKGRSIDGLNILPVETKAADASVTSRCIGNVIVGANIPELEETYLVGFENHGGQTYILPNHPAAKYGKPLGKVIVGFGNNAVEKHEGYVYKSVVGTYLHGSCLPKNPELANWLIQQAVTRFDKINGTNLLEETNWTAVDDTLAMQAKQEIINRFLK